MIVGCVAACSSSAAAAGHPAAAGAPSSRRQPAEPGLLRRWHRLRARRPREAGPSGRRSSDSRSLATHFSWRCFAAYEALSHAPVELVARDGRRATSHGKLHAHGYSWVYICALASRSTDDMGSKRFSRTYAGIAVGEGASWCAE
jgi:hypothetical protein